MILQLENKSLEISQEELDDVSKFIKNIDSIEEFQVFNSKESKQMQIIKRYNNGWDKNWLLYLVHTDGKKVNRISQNHIRQSCEHDESTNYWITIYKRHWWN